MKLALLQINPTVGDFQGNAQKIANGVRKSQALGADLAITPELALLGYPPRDLLLQPAFIENAWRVLENLALELKANIPVLVGIAEANNKTEGRPLYNCAVLIRDGDIHNRFHKTLLPTYDVFDEDRYFEPSNRLEILEINSRKIGVTICEDVWNDQDFWRRKRYHIDPVAELAQSGADAVINLSASPFTLGKQHLREKMLGLMAKKHHLPIFYLNQVGGDDDLVFDGRSCTFNNEGYLVGRANGFQEDILLADLISGKAAIRPDDPSPESEIWQALVTGTRDYAIKCGFKKVLLGLSGGIDSSLTAVIASKALGPENVLGVMMPSSISSQGSIDDAKELIANLGIDGMTLPISTIMQSFKKTLSAAFKGYQEDVTEENIQARIRGNLLMSLSNKYGSLLLTTGNKSEMAVGYCTLYGDMSGGLAVIADVPKMMVYRLANWINHKEGKQIIPANVIYKPPSAELRPGQTDQDSLPPYEILDAILERHIEQHKSASEIISEGFDPDTVNQVLKLVFRAEFKRKQAAPGIKVTDRAFGVGWRMPIAKKYWETGAR
jgi:NAD+ synthase (glutamine-hydrolysing)